MNKIFVLTVPKESSRSSTTPCSDSGAIPLRYILILSPFPLYGNRVLFSLNCNKFSLSSSMMYVQPVVIDSTIERQNESTSYSTRRFNSSLEIIQCAPWGTVGACYVGKQPLFVVKYHAKCIKRSVGKNAEFLTLNPTINILTTKLWRVNRTHNIIWRIWIMVLLREQFLPALLTHLLTYSMEQSPSWEANQ